MEVVSIYSAVNLFIQQSVQTKLSPSVLRFHTLSNIVLYPLTSFCPPVSAACSYIYKEERRGRCKT